MKKGVSLSFETIIVAVIALVILIVLIAIYTGFIGKSTKDIDKPATAAGNSASAASWCLNSIIQGKDCKDEAGKACTGIPDCVDVPKPTGTDTTAKCPDTEPRHMVAAKDPNNLILCCCTP